MSVRADLAAARREYTYTYTYTHTYLYTPIDDSILHNVFVYTYVFIICTLYTYESKDRLSKAYSSSQNFTYCYKCSLTVTQISCCRPISGDWEATRPLLAEAPMQSALPTLDMFNIFQHSLVSRSSQLLDPGDPLPPNRHGCQHAKQGRSGFISVRVLCLSQMNCFKVQKALLEVRFRNSFNRCISYKLNRLMQPPFQDCRN